MTMSRLLLYPIPRLALLAALTAALASAQGGAGTIAGNITDPTGAGVPSAEVIGTNIETNLQPFLVSQVSERMGQRSGHFVQGFRDPPQGIITVVIYLYPVVA